MVRRFATVLIALFIAMPALAQATEADYYQIITLPTSKAKEESRCA